MIDKSTALIPVNPPDAQVRLTRDDVWKGLMWKAEVPMPFVEPIVGCTILERYNDGFLREIQHLTPSGETEPIQERILLDPQNTVTFIRISGSAPGRIINEIVQQEGTLYLRFHFLLGVKGMTHRSPEELEYERGFAEGYLSAVNTTLDATREFMRTGVDPTAFQEALPQDYNHNEAEFDEVNRLYQAMHEQKCPVLHSEALGGFYLVASHRSVRSAAADWRTFSSADGIALPPLLRRAVPIEYDPPEHGWWRDLFKEVLNLTVYREVEDRVTSHARALIDAFAPRGYADLVSELAVLVPATTIMQIIGVNDPERILVAEKIGHDILLAARGSERGALPPNASDPLARFRSFCVEEIEARREQPRRDYLTRLAVDEVEAGRVLTDEEILDLLFSFLTAGHHSTASVLASLMDGIARDSRLRDRLVADPALIPKAAEEIVRLHPPGHGVFRTSTADAEIDGTSIPAGSKVMLSFAAANRDPEVFECPAQFLLDRKPNPHVGYGFGIHACVGAQLARLEIRIVIEQLLAKLPDIAHTGENVSIAWEFGNASMHERVPVRFTPRYPS